MRRAALLFVFAFHAIRIIGRRPVEIDPCGREFDIVEIIGIARRGKDDGIRALREMDPDLDGDPVVIGRTV